jgi:hypothetical protein
MSGLSGDAVLARCNSTDLSPKALAEITWRSERAVTVLARQTAAMNGDSANLYNLGSERRIRCALFVDFDNVYLGLRRLDPPAAEAFAKVESTVVVCEAVTT